MSAMKTTIAIAASMLSDTFIVAFRPWWARNAGGAGRFQSTYSCGGVTGVTCGLAWRGYINLTMKPLHLAVLILAATSYFTLSALIAAPHLFGF